MALDSKIDLIARYLENPKLYPYPNIEQDNLCMFLLAFLGDLFIQGYRVMQKIGNQTLILNLMEFSIQKSAQRNVETLPVFKIIHFEMSNENISDKRKRTQIFKDLEQITQSIGNYQIQIDILYLKNEKYSVMNKNELKLTRQPDSHHFFKSFPYLPDKKGYKVIDAMLEGTKMHASLEYYLKGQGFMRNPESFKRQVFGNNEENKLNYNITSVINTLRFIVGKQIMQKDFLIIDSEKWMRMSTVKDFKRFDLIMRSQNKICIIDWKFTDRKADQKIRARDFVKKNGLYFQLANKDYKSQVQLKFYCIHNEPLFDHYHKFSKANYTYKADQIILGGQQSNLESNGNNQFLQVANISGNQSTAFNKFKKLHEKNQNTCRNNSQIQSNSRMKIPLDNNENQRKEKNILNNKITNQEKSNETQKIRKKIKKNEAENEIEFYDQVQFLEISKKTDDKDKVNFKNQLIVDKIQRIDQFQEAKCKQIQAQSEDVFQIESLPYDNVSKLKKSRIKNDKALLFDPKNSEYSNLQKHLLLIGSQKTENFKRQKSLEEGDVVFQSKDVSSEYDKIQFDSQQIKIFFEKQAVALDGAKANQNARQSIVAQKMPQNPIKINLKDNIQEKSASVPQRIDSSSENQEKVCNGQKSKDQNQDGRTSSYNRKRMEEVNQIIEIFDNEYESQQLKNKSTQEEQKLNRIKKNIKIKPKSSTKYLESVVILSSQSQKQDQN